MSTTPARYQPKQRLIDTPERLEELYCERGLTIRQIENRDDVSVGRTRINQALDEYGIVRENARGRGRRDASRGRDPPPESSHDGVDWSAVE